MKTSTSCSALRPKGGRRFPRAAVLLTAGGLVLLCAGRSRALAQETTRKPTAAPSATSVAIDILPGEARNIVDTQTPGEIAVAILGSAQFDPRTVDLGSLHLAGAAAVKNAKGTTHAFEDVNADGRLDLVVWFSSREVQVGASDVAAVLEGKTLSGARFEGRDAIRTLDASLRAEARPPGSPAETAAPGSEEKLPPLRAGIVIVAESSPRAWSLPMQSHDPESGAGYPIAVLAAADLDPADIVLETVRLNGASPAKLPTGDVAAFEDVDGDGRLDLVLAAPTHAPEGSQDAASSTRRYELAGTRSGSVRFSAATRTGRIVLGETQTASKTGPDEEGGAGSSQSDPAQGTAALSAPGNTTTGHFAGAISIPDQTHAVQYPATIHMSGLSGVVSKVRVTLNAIIHSCFIDLDIMLVGPTGQSIVLMSDVGGCGPANATDLTFDDFATGTMSSAQTPPTPSTWRPYNQVVGDPFAAPAPPASLTTALSSFIGTNPNGDWKLYVMDDAGGDTGQISDGWTLDIETMTQVCNVGSFTIPAGAPGVTSGPASLYPSAITVSGLPPQIAKVSVTLDGLTHQAPEDLDVMLVAPGGQRVMLMSDSGGLNGIANYQLTLDDDGAGFLPDDTVIVSSGTYRPSDRLLLGPLPPPAPGGNYYTALSPLRGTDPNGAWQLYVADHAAGSVGSLARGWCLNITTIAPADSCQPFPLVVPAGAPGVTSGPADIYPNTLRVAGQTGLVQNARITLMGLTHTFPDDLDILLETPSHRTLMLMSDVGGSADISNLNITFDTAAAVSAPDNSALGPGPYRPTDADPGDSLPGPAPAAPYGSSLYGEPPNGTWKIWVADDGVLDWGTMSALCVSYTLFEPYVSVCSTDFPLTIPGGGTAGIAFPYPWAAYVTQDGAIVGKVQVRLQTVTHSFPDDLDVLLVGPQGQSVVLMSDAGGSADANQAWLTFDDEALDALPDTTLLNTGTYRPSNYNGGDADTFPPSAPPGPYGSQLSVFRGTDPKGYWNLFVNDDASGDTGSISQWCLDIFPLYPVGEATNLRWSGSSKTTLTWDAAPNATGYQVLRGTPNFLTSLLTGDTDSCIAVSPSGQVASGLAQLPGTGSMFWYLVTGTNGGPAGPAGRARIGSSETARITNPVGSCNAP